MIEKSKHHESDLPVQSQRPGELLKGAREKLELSCSDIGRQLNLQVKIIEAIEEDRIEYFPAVTYLRGYIRSYAKLVKLDGDQLISLLENEPHAPPEIVPDVKSSGQASSQDKPVKAISYLVTFILALLLIAWLQSKYILDQPGVKQSPTTELSTEKADAEIPASGDDNEWQTMQDQDTYSSMSGLQINQEVDMPVVNEDDVGDSALPLINEIEIETETGELNAVIDEEISPEDGNTLLQGNNSTDELLLRLNGDSWIEVYDADNKRLYIGTAKSGEVISLAGVKPLSVLLGYSPVVEVIFNGKIIDTSPHTVGGVARFSLGLEDNQN